MLVIKVNKENGDYFTTKISADIKQIAEYYFATWKDIRSIEILEGGIIEAEHYSKKLLEIWRVDDEIVKEFELEYNVRLEYEITYKKSLADGTNKIINSCGLTKVY